jgi:hypothetical protein
MPSHIILHSVVVYYSRFGVILAVDLLYLVVDGIGAVGELLDYRVHWGVVLGVLAEGPVVLMADICPTDFVVETVAFLLYLSEELFGCLRLFNVLYLCLYIWQ